MSHSTIQTMDEATAWLASYIPAPQQMHQNYTLDRMQAVMALFDNPQDSFRSIHIAGTSGKTSTAYFVRHMVEQAGKVTGLTISPHITSVTERIQLNGHVIPDDTFLSYLNNVNQTIAASDIRPTYYELLVALAYVIFREEAIDYAVVETGLGGLLDATNVITRPDKLCVITDIGLDHTDVLGKTLDEIALQKAGIVQPGNIVVIQAQAPHIQDVLAQRAKERGATNVIIASNTAAPTQLPEFQQHNWAIATQAYRTLAARDSLPNVDTLQLDAAQAQPPGRMETFQYKGKTVIMDGAHNGQKMQALVSAVRQKYHGTVTALVSFAGNESNRIEDGLRELLPITGRLVVTDFSVQRDVGKTASSSDEIRQYAQKACYEHSDVIPNPEQALEYAVQQPGDVIVVTGSLYLVALLRPLLRGV